MVKIKNLPRTLTLTLLKKEFHLLNLVTITQFFS